MRTERERHKKVEMKEKVRRIGERSEVELEIVWEIQENVGSSGEWGLNFSYFGHISKPRRKLQVIAIQSSKCTAPSDNLHCYKVPHRFRFLLSLFYIHTKIDQPGRNNPKSTSKSNKLMAEDTYTGKLHP